MQIYHNAITHEADKLWDFYERLRVELGDDHELTKTAAEAYWTFAREHKLVGS